MTEKHITDEMQMLLNNKKSGYNYRERRHDQWNETYTLYRDTVITDRLVQRQTVNIPLMKQTVRTILKDIDDMPVLYYENLDNDKTAEQFKNEFWNITVEENNMTVQDIVDKRQVLLFGRSFDQWQIMDGRIKQTIQDPMDLLVDRYCDPTNLDSSRFLIHQHIFTLLSVIERNDDYDKEAVARLKTWYASTMGLIKSTSNQESLTDKNKKMQNMGLDDVDSPILGETVAELTIHLVWRAEADDEEEQIYMYVEADDREVLMKKPLEEVIGKTKDNFWRSHYNYVTWGDDVERQDFWSDGIGDIVRQPNKLLNVFMSQEAENRTLRNFGMTFYNAKNGFNPNTYQARPFGFYGVPGNPKDLLQRVDIPQLAGNIETMQYMIQMVEKATGATATQQGNVQTKSVTLGEVELALGEAKERTKGMSKFYTPAWKRRGLIFDKLIEAGADKLDMVKIWKKGKNTNDLYGREIYPKDWMTKSGYRCKIWTQEEKNSQTTDSLQKMNLAKTTMPDNPKLDEIYKRKLLEFADLTPEENNQVMDYERRKQEQFAQAGLGQNQALPVTPQGQPQAEPTKTPPNPLQGEAVNRLQTLQGA